MLNNITYTQINTAPTYNNVGYSIPIDIVYFTEIILINNNTRTFFNNIKSYKVNNKYNYNVQIYYKDYIWS